MKPCESSFVASLNPTIIVFYEGKSNKNELIFEWIGVHQILFVTRPWAILDMGTQKIENY